MMNIREVVAEQARLWRLVGYRWMATFLVATAVLFYTLGFVFGRI